MSNMDDLPRLSQLKIRTPGSDHWSRFLLQNFGAFQGGHSAKATRPVEHERLDFSRWNAPCHWAPLIRTFLAKSNMISLLHTSYSPNLASEDFTLFSKVQRQLKDRYLNTVAEIQGESQKILDSLTENYFQVGFQKWQKLWDWCIAKQGNRDIFYGT